MTDIEQEARDLLNAIRTDRGQLPSYRCEDSRKKVSSIEAVCRALEQRNAVQKELDDFKREVSDKVQIAVQDLSRIINDRCLQEDYLWHTINAANAELAIASLILPAPVDPKVAALREWLKSRGISDPNDDVLADDFARLEAILAEHGGEVVFKGNDAP